MIDNNHPTLVRLRQAQPEELELIGGSLREDAYRAGASWEQIEEAENTPPHFPPPVRAAI
jgi:hypothetical protein